MIQISGMVEIDGTIREEFDLLLKPIPGKEINPEALAVNKRSVEELQTFPSAAVALRALCKLYGKYVNRFDGTDKFVPAGYNVNFDLDFLRETWKCALPSDRYGVGCYLFNAPVDVRSFLAQLVAFRGLRLPNYKLSTACEHFGIKMGSGAHDALNDIRATRELMLRCQQELSCK